MFYSSSSSFFCFCLVVSLLPLLSCTASAIDPETSYLGFKDFWPLTMENGQVVWTNSWESSAKEELETAFDVATRLNDFMRPYMSDGKLEIINIAYPFYSQYALRNRDQRERNAPLAVNRLQDDNKRNGDVHTITNMEVWRVNYRTNDITLFKKLTPDERETVESGVSIHGVDVIILAMSCLLPLIMV